jgi:hypothetical protein
MWHVDLFPLGPLHSGNSLSGSVKIPELPQRFRQLLWAAIAPTKLSRSPGLAPGSLTALIPRWDIGGLSSHEPLRGLVI